jgi:hypothetical protein
VLAQRDGALGRGEGARRDEVAGLGAGMVDTDDKETKGRKWPSTEVTVAVISLVGVLGAAIFSNWEKIFPPAAQPPGQPTEQAATSVARISAPVPLGASCDVTIPWPAETHFMIVSWEPVSGAGYYSVEMDCLGCGGGAGWFSLREDRHWHLREEVGLRAPRDEPAIYSSDIHVRLRREGGRALRWRVWGVDHDGVAGYQSAWCRISFSGEMARP